jgi:hypothetical protein
MADKYYIREADDEEARGPYNPEQLLTLVEASQLSLDTLYYDERLESWVAIRANEELSNICFPAKRSLKLKPTSADGESIPDSEGEAAPYSVEDMLAAAEGDTDEARHLRVIVNDRERAASLMLPLMGTVLLVLAASVLYPAWNVIDNLIEGKAPLIDLLMDKPVLILGVADLFLALLLFLGVSAVFPLIRFRALAGMGFFGVLWWAHGVNGDPEGFYKCAAAVAVGLGLFSATLCSRTRSLFLAVSLAFAGAVVLLLILNFMPLIDGWRGE